MAKFKRVNPIDQYRKEVDSVLKGLPEGWRKDFFIRFPQYDTRAGSSLVENVVHKRSSDTAVLECLKSLERWYKRQVKKQKKGVTNGN